MFCHLITESLVHSFLVLKLVDQKPNKFSFFCDGILGQGNLTCLVDDRMFEWFLNFSCRIRILGSTMRDLYEPPTHVFL